MPDYLALDVKALEREIDALIAQYPELAEDDELRADMIEGETSLEKIASRIVRRRNLANANIVGLKSIIDEFAARRKRFEAEKEAMSGMMQAVMNMAGQNKLMLPEATISITKGRESVEIVSVDDLPQGYVKTFKSADKTAIGDAIRSGEYIPGAVLVTGDPSVTIRTK